MFGGEQEAHLSEATRRKLHRRAQIIQTEVKAELAKAIAQLRHSTHHFKHTKGELERALRFRDRKTLEFSRAEGRAQALENAADESKQIIEDLYKVPPCPSVRPVVDQSECNCTDIPICLQACANSAREAHPTAPAATSSSIAGAYTS